MKEVAPVPPRATASVPVVSAMSMPRVEVATSAYPEPVPRRICPKVGVDERPVPPFAGVSAVESVSAPVEENEDVAEPPKYAVVAENIVELAPPLKFMREVVAETSPLFAWSGPFNAPASVSAPVDEKDEVADPPKNAWVAEKSVEEAPPLNTMSDVVADCPVAG